MGRPKKPANEKARRVDVTVSPTALHAWNWLAAQAKVNRSTFLVRLLRNAASAHRLTIEEAAERGAANERLRPQEQEKKQ